MSILEKAAYALINGKRTIDRPIFIKEFENENEQLLDLIELSSKVGVNKKEIIDRDITLLKQGLDGEQNVYFELKNSFIPMLCLHDIRLEYDSYVAQLDFVIITNKFIYVLETKKLNGDIEITKDGDFIRTIKSYSGKVIKKEGIYSPISQNERHINILKEILLKEKLIRTTPIKSAVILANPKTILNKTNCPKSIQNNIYKYDQLTTLLKKELNDKTNDKNVLEKYSYEIADYLLKNNKPLKINYAAKYSLDEVVISKEEELQKQDELQCENKLIKEELKNEIPVPKVSVDGQELYELLRQFRLKASREEGIKPYFIFNNQELDALILAMPKSREELTQVKGFGDKKIEKYGDEILSILNSKFI
jgi:hypothetical protein